MMVMRSAPPTESALIQISRETKHCIRKENLFHKIIQLVMLNFVPSEDVYSLKTTWGSEKSPSVGRFLSYIRLKCTVHKKGYLYVYVVYCSESRSMQC